MICLSYKAHQQKILISSSMTCNFPIWVNRTLIAEVLGPGLEHWSPNFDEFRPSIPEERAQ